MNIIMLPSEQGDQVALESLERKSTSLGINLWVATCSTVVRGEDWVATHNPATIEFFYPEGEGYQYGLSHLLELYKLTVGEK